MHIKSATEEKTVKNMKKCAGYNEWLCVMMALRIRQLLASKSVNTCRWFCKYKEIRKVG